MKCQVALGRWVWGLFLGLICVAGCSTVPHGAKLSPEAQELEEIVLREHLSVLLRHAESSAPSRECILVSGSSMPVERILKEFHGSVLPIFSEARAFYTTTGVMDWISKKPGTIINASSVYLNQRHGPVLLYAKHIPEGTESVVVLSWYRASLAAGEWYYYFRRIGGKWVLLGAERSALVS